MPQRSRFTKNNREIILEAIKNGNSLRTAAGLARITDTTLRRWIKEGEDAPAGSLKRTFAEDIAHAHAVATHDMVEIVKRDAHVEKNVKSAMWWLERRDKAFRPPQHDQPAPRQEPVVINLAFADGRPLGGEIVLEAVEQKELEQNNSA